MTNQNPAPHQSKDRNAQKGSVTIVLLACILLAIIFIGGCLLSKSNDELQILVPAETQKENPSIVYINVDRVANELGLMDQATKKLETANKSLQATREEARSKLQTQVTDAENKLGDNPTIEEKQQLLGLLQQGRDRLSQVDQQLNQIANKNKLTLVNAVRTQIFPIAQTIATDLGATSIQELEATVFWHDEQWDISDKVIARMRSENKAEAKKKVVLPPTLSETPPDSPSK